MSECQIHQLTFGPEMAVPFEGDAHWFEEERANVADFECPTCGLKLFVYYRVVPKEAKSSEQQEEGDTK